MIFSRRVSARVWINKTDITSEISGYLRGITYEDCMSGEADTLEIELQDKERLFVGEWFPTRGDSLEVELRRINWSGEGEDFLPLGLFEIDEITCSFPPNIARIKANSISRNSGLRQRDQSRSWENVPLSKIANDIAAAAGVALFYDTSDDPVITRAEQSELSSLFFLEKLCKDKGLALKASDEKIIIFDEQNYELRDPIMTINYDNSSVKQFRATATVNEIYAECHVKYKKGKNNQLIESRFRSRAEGLTLEINEKVEDQSAADRLARKKLRAKNKEEIKINMTVIGDFELLSGQNVLLNNFGFFDGKYIIEKASHKIGSGYEIQLELRRCLDGY